MELGQHRRRVLVCMETESIADHRVGGNWVFGNCNVLESDWMVFPRLPEPVWEENTVDQSWEEEDHSGLGPDLAPDSASINVSEKVRI